MKLLSVILINLITFQAIANCPQSVIALDKGEEAPCKGFLFSPAKEKELRLLNEKYQLEVEQNNNLKKQIKLTKEDVKLLEKIVDEERKKAELWRSRAEKSTMSLIESNSSMQYRDWLMITAGIALTITSGWALGQAAK